MRKKKIILAALLVPFLMSNSPAPFPSSAKYESVDIGCTLIKRTEDDFQYEFRIHNKGTMYGILEIWQNDIFLRGEFKDRLFADELVAPGDDKKYSFVSKREIDIDPETNKWALSTYDVVDNNVTFSNPSFVKISERRYRFDSDIANLGDYYYNALIDLDYEGVSYALSVSFDENKYFNTTKELDLEKVNIKKVTAVKSTYNRYNPSKKMMVMFYGPFLLFFVGVFLVVPGVVASIIVISHKLKKRKKVNK